MYKVGLTGGIACGKTTVDNFLREAGADIIDTDKIAHALTLPGKSLCQAYIDHFGKKILLEDGKALNRRMIARLAFADGEEKAWLNNTSHPLIWQAIEEEMKVLTKANKKVVVIDVPLLFEVGWDAFVDEKWVVYIDKKTQIARLRQRNGYNFAEAKLRIRAQMPLSEKLLRADKIIDTGHPLKRNRKRVLRLWNSLLQRLENGK